MGFEAPLWRAIAVFRLASLGYAGLLVVQHHELVARPWAAWGVLAVMAVWTAATAYAYTRPRRRDGPLLVADLGISFGCLLATAVAVAPGYLAMAPPLTATWIAGAVLATGVVRGRRWAVSAALGYGVADISVRVVLGVEITAAVPRGVVLLLLAGFAVGYMATYAGRAERRFARAVELEARTREREQLARSIHDSVLQVLAMVQRRGAEIGGEAAELGRLAGEQEAKLRGLIGVQARGGGRAAAGAATAGADDAGSGAATAPHDGGEGGTDLNDLLAAHASDRVTVSGPAEPVTLPARAAEEVDAAVRAALANVEAHCPAGTRVWLLVEEEPHPGTDTGATVTVTVRDDGPGMPPERVDEAAAEGRLGLAQSIRGRVADLGGGTTIHTAPGEGTEIELRVPRPPASH